MRRIHRFGLALVASASLGAGCLTGARPHPLAWDVVSLKNDDWRGTPRQAPLIEGEDVVLRGQNIRTQRSYSAPITVEFDAMLESRVADDGALMCELVPSTQALDKEPERNLRVLFQYDQQGDAISVQERFQRWPTPNYKIWSRSPLSINTGNWHHMKYEVTNGGLNISVDGRTYDSDGAGVPYKVFYVSLLGWQPTNRWHVRNFSIH
jgi:hypothetical protein